MLSTLPKLADKAFIVGFFLPCLLFAIASLTLFSDVPKIHEFLILSQDSKNFEKLVYLVLAVWTLAVFMTIINTAQYKILEGYKWPLSAMKSLHAKEMARFVSLDDRVYYLRTARYQAGGKLPDDEETELRKTWLLLRRDFPDKKALVLPTRFGNAIRAFEQYANSVYGADSVTLWYHLSSVIPKEFQSLVTEARSQVDCLVNIIFLAAAIGVCANIRLAAASALWMFGDANLPHVGLHIVATDLVISSVTAIVAPLIVYFAYKLSLERVYVWGDWVKASFDCYLPDLAKRLALALPAKNDEQMELWKSVSRRASLHHPFSSEKWAAPADQKAPENKKFGECQSESSHKDGQGDDKDNKHAENGSTDNDDSQGGDT
jgi:hypothetical protein